ncbi:sorting nexin-21 [Ornithorhynchus anatinus]|uniref:sorting nexin-21 n=1 Tax=Ornithorhynchus anatinus TaxID=9258 RepID=UPI0010A7EC78|nr:sorting nexin-21 [Ornithorhynchus anatinus]
MDIWRCPGARHALSKDLGLSGKRPAQGGRRTGSPVVTRYHLSENKYLAAAPVPGSVPGPREAINGCQRSPPPDGPRGAALLTRQLRGPWRRSRGGLGPQRLLFEVTGADAVSEPPSECVPHTVALRRPGRPDRPPARPRRRHSDPERPRRRRRGRVRGPVAAAPFPRRRLRRDPAAETIARRGRAIGRFPGHVQAVPGPRRGPPRLLPAAHQGGARLEGAAFPRSKRGRARDSGVQ